MQQKNKQQHQKSTIVEFSNLNDNNKTQFLQFLLRNNITFEKAGAKGNDDYVAKVTLPKPNIKANKQNNNNLTKNNHSHVDNTKIGNKNKTLHPKNPNNISISKSIESSIKINTPQKTKLTNLNTSLAKNSSTPLNQNKKAINTIQSKSPKSNSHRNLRKIEKPIQNIQGIIKKSSPITIRTTSEFLANENLQNLKNRQTIKIQKNIKKLQTQISNKKINKNNIIEIKNKKENKQKQNFYMQKEKTILEKSKSSQKYQKILKKDIVQKQKIVEVNNQIKRKTEEQKQICQLVNRYLKLFDLKLMGQRPIKWSFTQLVRTIQEIYNQLFIKNTQSLTQKGYTKLEHYGTGGQSSHSFIKFIKQFFGNKHKNQKLATSNLINMLYSLSCYLQNEKKISHVSQFGNNILTNGTHINARQIIKQIKQNNKLTISGIFLQIFQDFLCQIYQYEQLLFYLFIRSIIISQLYNLNHSSNLMSNRGTKMQNKSGYIMQKQIHMNYKDIIRILKLIFGQDQDLIQQYKLMILTRINYHQLHPQPNQQCLIKISAPEFLTIMVEDYRVKRLIVQDNNQPHQPLKNQFNNSIDHHSLTSENTFQEIPHLSLPKKKQHIFTIKNQPINNQTDQLTFGQQTQSNIDRADNQSNFHYEKQFWQSIQCTELFNKVQQFSVERLICEKMKKKVLQFYNILIENKSEYNSVQNKKNEKNNNKYKSYDRQQIMNLLTKKSINLLGCIVEMNKLKWFQELRVIDPNQDDIDKVQQLQLAFRRLKNNPDADSIGKLCKNILTVSQFTIALEKLIFM